ncbi:HEAT repeat-containing protein 6 [Nymphon striatum]|nr:HEAT repeat-containing protein 6 [Nymphon striatum]
MEFYSKETVKYTKFGRPFAYVHKLGSLTTKSKLCMEHRYKTRCDSFNLDFRFLLTQVSEPFLQLFCQLIPVKEELLIAKVLHYIVITLDKRNVNVSSNCVLTLTEYLKSYLEHCGEWLHADILLALSSVLHGNSSIVEKYLDKLIGENGLLLKFCSVDFKDVGVRILALNCIGSIAVKSVNGPSLPINYIKICYQILLNAITEIKPLSPDEIAQSKVFLSALKGLQNALLCCKNIHIEDLGVLLGALKFHTILGYPGSVNSHITSLYPTPIGQYLPSTSTNLKNETEVSLQNMTSQPQVKRNKKKHCNQNRRKRNNDKVSSRSEDSANNSFQTNYSSEEPTSNFTWMLASSSESEYSDTEGGQRGKLKSLQVKVRLSAFGTLLTVIKVRSAAVSVVCAMIEQAKQFLFLADDSQSHRTAFTSFSITVADMIKELHRCLTLAVIAETSSMSLTQLIKCLSVLVASTPYHKLKRGLLTKVVRNVRPLLSHRVHSVQVASLSVMASIISKNPPLDEILELMYHSTSNGTSQDVNTNDGIWLFDACISNVIVRTEEGHEARSDIALPIRLESLQVLSLFVECQFLRIRHHIDLLTKLIDGCLLDSDFGIQLHGVKLLKSIACSMLQEVSNQEGVDEHLINQAMQFWTKCLNGPLPSLLQKLDQKALQTVGCDCLASISSIIFEKLPIDKRVLCVTLTLGLTHDNDKNLKSSAIRALGMFVVFPILRKDALFLADVTDIVITAMSDENLMVRIKTAWSLANLTDTLLYYKENVNDEEEISFEELFPFDLLHELFKVCTNSSKDSDKVKYNIVRALGNLLRIIPLSFIEQCETRKGSVFKAFDCLTESVLTGLDKVRWNACYSAGNFFHNDKLMEECPAQFNNVFSALIKMLTSCPNYKVRINAASALSILNCRSHFGPDVEKYLVHLKCLLNALDTLEDITDFNEFKHMETLRNQVIRCILHLLSLARESDVNEILTCVESKISQLKNAIIKFRNCTNIEKPDECIAKALKNIERISSNQAGNLLITVLTDLLKPECCNFMQSND